jgi:hypothetical protein
MRGRRTMNTLIPAIAGLAIAVGLQTPGFAVEQKLFAGEHKVIGMYVNAGNANSQEILPGVDTTVDQATISCPKATCTLALSAMLAIEDGDGAHEWQIVVLVDGKTVGSPLWQGVLPTNYYLTGSWQGKYVASKGSHVVTFQIYGASNFILDDWSDTVIITDP